MTETSASTTPSGLTVVDGVPAHWADLPIDPTIALFFGVGHEDMDPRTVGITHLIEHLVMREVGRVRIPHNAESSARSTSFYATGPVDQVADFLEKVCVAVTGLPDVDLDDLEKERRTVLAEIGPAGLYATNDSFTVRYGARRTGLAALAHVRLMDWTADEVRDVARRWFHRGNARLTSTVPLPDGLSLPLPDAPAPVRAPHPPSLLAGPTWSEHGGDDLVLSGECSTTTDPTTRALAVGVLTDVLTQTLRTAQGEVYSVQSFAVQVDDDREVWTLSSDPGPGRVCDVLVATLDVLDRLASTGPTADEIEDTREPFLNETQLSGFHAGWLDAEASYALRGFATPSLADVRATLRSVDPSALARVLAELRASLLVCLPLGHLPHDEALARLDSAGFRRTAMLDESMPAPRRGTRYRGRHFSPARGLVVTVCPDRLVLAEPGRSMSVPFADVVLAGTDADGDVELVTGRGGNAMLVPGLFRGMARSLDRVLEQVPPGARYVKSRRGEVERALTEAPVVES